LATFIDFGKKEYCKEWMERGMFLDKPISRDGEEACDSMLNILGVAIAELHPVRLSPVVNKKQQNIPSFTLESPIFAVCMVYLRYAALLKR
jgi:hypothetical protein